MKTILYIFVLLNSSFALGQKNDVAIKVYLEDAYTGKNITDAKVTLEGFEIPEIVGKYDKKGKFYYFTEIPEGYNTVMTYHKKYNEKGFQNTKGLPKELRLKLYTPYRVKIPNDTINYYFEDSFKIAVLMNDTLLNLRDNNYAKTIKSYFKKHYPKLVVHTDDSFTFFINDYSFYVTKKNGKPFKRFNDPIINKIENDNNILITFGVLLRTQYYEPKTKSLKTFFTEEGTPVFLPKKMGYFKGDDLYERYIVQDEDPYFYFESANSVKGIKDTITNVPDLFLSYKQKYKKGLLDNHIYTLNKKEEATLYKYYEDRKNKGYLYNFRIDFDSKDIPYFNYPTTIRDTKEFPYGSHLPYVFASNILKFSSLGFEWDSKNRFTYLIIYKSSTALYTENLKSDYDKFPELIEKIKINDFSEVFKLKNTNASPFGIMDIIEFYNKDEINLNYKTAVY